MGVRECGAEGKLGVNFASCYCASVFVNVDGLYIGLQAGEWV